uniref:Uncharacterized protein n=1 Tax=Arundo donax TaxID=35708 RepID=A0A0A9ERP2_ARUDO
MGAYGSSVHHLSVHQCATVYMFYLCTLFHLNLGSMHEQFILLSSKFCNA